nr:retrovirus-related Pol polyprotein from transposon TNT 1-94 [Tanacetum cinerariifolium]
MQTQKSKIDMGKAVNDDLVVTESSGTESKVQDDNSKSGNDTNAHDADIRPIYDEEPMTKVQLNAECNIFAIGQQHTEQPKIINEGWVDQYPKQRHVKSPMFDSSLNNLTNDYSKQSLESENSLLKQTVAQFQKDFSRMEAHCIALELKYQNQALKSGQHGQVLNAESNKAKIKKDIDVFETINIELKHKVANFRKENETLKKHYKDLKLKGNSVDTKFAKTSVLGKPVLRPLRNQSVVRQPNVCKHERPPMSKQQFASQVDVNHNVSKPVTQHYLPKKSESAFAKPDHRDRNSKPSVMTPARFQSTTADSKPKPRSTIHSSRSLPMSKSSCVTIPAMPKADHSKSPISFSDHTRFFCSTCNKCVFNANHDACITKLLKEVNSRAKIQSHKTSDRNKPVDQKSHTQIPGRQIFTGHKFSPNKTSAVYEKISPRSDLRWKPTGRIFKFIGHRWLPTGKLFDSCTSTVESEPTHGSNEDISKIHECKQTLDLSAKGIQHQTSIARTPEQNCVVERRKRTLVEAARTMLSAAKVPLFFWAEAIATACFTQNRSLVIPRHEKTPYHIINDRKPSVKFFHIFGSTMASVQNSSDPAPECQTMVSDQLSSDPAPECQNMALNHDSLSPANQRQANVTQADRTVTTSNELDLLFSPMFDELLNGSSKVVSKSSVVSATDAPNQCQQYTTPLHIHTTPAPIC